MIFNTVYVELKNKRNYYFTTTVFDIPILVNVYYNNKVRKRLISVQSTDGEYVYLKPSYIERGARLIPNFTFKMNEVEMFITLNDFKNSGSEDYLNWGNTFRLAFVNPVEEDSIPTQQQKVTDFFAEDGEEVV